MGLVCLVVGLDLMNIVWYKLFYHMDPGRTIGWFGGVFDLVPDFFINNAISSVVDQFHDVISFPVEKSMFFRVCEAYSLYPL